MAALVDPGSSGARDEGHVVVTLLIVTWNGRALLERCLESVRGALDGVRAQIVVIDNASTDGTDTMIAHAFSDVEYLRLDRNLGFAIANNRGLEVATGEWVMLLNNDATVEPSTLSALLAAARAHPAFDVLAPEMVRMAEPSRVDTRGIFLEHTGHLRQLDAGLPVVPARGSCEVFGASGGAMLVRRSVVERHGLFDESLESYIEDGDLACRLRAAGVRTLYVPDARVHHEGSATGNRIADRKFYLIQRNATIVRRRWLPFAMHARQAWLALAYDAFQVMRAAFAGRLALVVRAKRDALRVPVYRPEGAYQVARVRAWSGLRARPVDADARPDGNA